MSIPPEQWIWLGEAAHFICGPWCRWHLATVVGPWLVSSVGEYVPQGQNPARDQPEWVGCNRLYETMVFRAKRCDCGAPLCSTYRIESGENVDFAPANDAHSARENHMALCAKWAARAAWTIADARGVES